MMLRSVVSNLSRAAPLSATAARPALLSAQVRCLSASAELTPLELKLQDAGLPVERMSGALGAEMSGVNLNTLSDEHFALVTEALNEYQVLFFRGQHDLKPASHVALGKRFGKLEMHDIVKGLPDFPEVVQIVREDGEITKFGETWHSDLSFSLCPTSISVLRAVEVPRFGNDTLWASMYSAYESLSDGLKQTLDGLHAVHGAGRAFSADGERESKYDEDDETQAMKYKKSKILDETVVHPIVRTHPDTGRKALYVNSMFTYGIDGWTEEESKPLLDFLYQHAARPEHTVRFRWKEGSVAMWDNRAVQHVALADNADGRRIMQRVTVAGERPV